MKNYFILISLFLVTVSLSSNELSWVDEQVEAIKPARTGIDNSTISSLNDPFISAEKLKSKTVKSRTSSKKTYYKKRTKLYLKAIMNNSALINGKWRKINDKIGSYKLSKIDNTSVVLTSSGKKIVLSTNSKVKNLKFKK